MTEVVNRLRHFDLLTYSECLDVLSSPLFHEPNPPSPRPVPQLKPCSSSCACVADQQSYTELLTPDQILVENYLHGTNHQSLFEIYNEYSEEAAPKSRGDIPAIPEEVLDLAEEINSCLPYIPPLKPKVVYYHGQPLNPRPSSPGYHVAIPFQISGTPRGGTPVQQAPPPSSRRQPPLVHMDIPPPTEKPQPPPSNSSPITSPITVSCNGEEGVLYPKQLCRGSRGRCIYYGGSWMTPNQFEFHCGKTRARHWKRSIFTGDKTLVPYFRDGSVDGT
eukprot:sb/3468026/